VRFALALSGGLDAVEREQAKDLTCQRFGAGAGWLGLGERLRSAHRNGAQ
jgi:hypothetical protein